ncbi:hypothetical protein Vretifemale_14790 [Volvox reticuliferus]|uniref:Uncharacterized protein n=1 Tax=Volvox reticuliferus TaxID=1737510 RepID=A0A8J4CQR6_9CHLO|nr:hypothetical protein Vretifemale_14790 [Volvox reticuliferus]
MEAVYKGRALPPRPSLLVGKAGDIEACRSSWAQLQPVATELLRRAEAGCASVEDLDNAVRRFRSLRESLVAAYVRDEMAVQRGAGPSSSSRSRASQPTFTRTLRRNSCSDKRPQPSPLPQGRLRQLLLQRRAANRWPAAGSIGKKTSACVPSASAPVMIDPRRGPMTRMSLLTAAAVGEGTGVAAAAKRVVVTQMGAQLPLAVAASEAVVMAAVAM